MCNIDPGSHSHVSLASAMRIPSRLFRLLPVALQIDEAVYPSIRFSLWNGTSPLIREAAISLRYNHSTWNLPGTAEVEKLSYETINSTATMEVLGMNEVTWDCYMNHYGAFDWEELLEEEVQESFERLGWTREAWESEIDEPTTEEEDWYELSDEQRLAASDICYFRETWDELDMDEWGATLTCGRPGDPCSHDNACCGTSECMDFTCTA